MWIRPASKWRGVSTFVGSSAPPNSLARTVILVETCPRDEPTVGSDLVETKDQAVETPGATVPAVHDELVSKIIDTICTEGMIDREKVTPDATIESLDLKSIDIVMILTAIEDKFDVYIPMDGPFHEAKNVGDLIEAIASYIEKEKQQA